MASNNPSTPVKVPPSAANYTAATLDQDLRSQINSLLIKEGHVTKIQEHLLHSLNANPANWPTLIQNHALSLLRSGEVASFPTLIKRVLDDVRHDTALAPPLPYSGSNPPTPTPSKAVPANGEEGGATTNGATTNGASATNGSSISVSTTPLNKDPNQRPSLAVPQAVIADALRVTREALEAVVDIDENGTT
ncbi:hypothetical protein QBC42DRAFT_280341 [Cladorrhinum samala]|uniref:Uncharacterized protein n=1 Tax=Cladorrhinum samala TaxID=585594 RepID=A0AAV9HAF4_9PEZI|nr:hypothetical protein QBC42DRAFT_280341 [Cladorrhinum samala]